MNRYLATCGFSLLAVLTACGGQVNYTPPTTTVAAQNSRTVSASRDQVWNKLVPALSSQFFVINTIDRSSGLINVSYGGDPEKYVDCGRIRSYVKNLRGERTYDFPGAQAQATYEMMNDNGLFVFNRSMKLEGRVNIVVQDIGPQQTLVTASTRYVVTRTNVITALAGPGSGNTVNSISLNSGSGDTFPGPPGQATRCVATGKLEQDIIALSD
ncbi:hypothetical protein [Roseomonas gilardii]|uniref:hypothetical protein n=1 Tax=Roseomonas gilardii TaxID=257708 RepID=UPI0011A80C81|nr:hypothetical protein [Roseomonas gilardii]